MSDFLQFKPAQYFQGKDCYVGYYVVNPFTKKMVRKKIKLNHITSARERKRYGTRLAFEINTKLYDGWNPFLDEANVNSKKIEDAVTYFIEDKVKTLRNDSIRCYRSFAKTFTEWCKATNMASEYCFTFERVHAVKLMESLERKGLSNKSYNNYCAFFSTLFLYFIDKGWCQKNPFDGIKHKRKEEKQRSIIPKEDRQRIIQYFENRDMHGFTVMMHLCFQCLIRPKEMLMLRVSDIDFQNNIISISGKIAKNHNRREIAIPKTLMSYFQTLKGEDKGKYLFSTGYKPGKKMLTSRDSGRTWSEMRTALNLPSEYQFYSLKDTGITEMLEAGVPAKFVKELADHHSLEMTERYTHRSNAKKILEYNNLDF